MYLCWMPYFRAFVKNLTMARATLRLFTDRLSPEMDTSSNYGFAKGARCEIGPVPDGTMPRARLSSSAASPFAGIGDRRPADRSRQRIAMRNFLRGPARVVLRGRENLSSQSRDKSIAVSSRSAAGYPRTLSRRGPGHATRLTPCKAALPNRPLPRKKARARKLCYSVIIMPVQPRDLAGIAPISAHPGSGHSLRKKL